MEGACGAPGGQLGQASRVDLSWEGDCAPWTVQEGARAQEQSAVFNFSVEG